MSSKRELLDIAERKFNNLIESTELIVERLPRKCVASFIIQDNIDKSLAIKLFIQPQSPEWQLKSGKFRGICLLWQEGKSLIIVDSRIHPSSLVYLPTVRKILPDYCVLKTNLISVLINLLRDSSENADEIRSQVKSKIGSIEVAARKRQSYTLEARCQQELIKILDANQYILTPEGCKADAGYRIANSSDSYIPIQTKSCSMGTGGRLNVFNQTAGYVDELLLCRPMLEQSVGTLVIPGHLAPSAIGLTLTSTSKYMPYVIKDNDLKSFLNTVCTALENKQTNVTWPSGLQLSIQGICLKNIDNLSIPLNPSSIVEREAYLWREKIFFDICYDRPPAQHSTVDIIMNGVRMQDKVCISDNGRVPVSLFKNYNLGKHQPYHENDFDALFVFLKCRKYFFLIPSYELTQRGYMSKANQLGKQTLHVYTPQYVYRKGVRPDLWSQHYCYDTSVENNLKECLQKIRWYKSNIL